MARPVKYPKDPEKLLERKTAEVLSNLRQLPALAERCETAVRRCRATIRRDRNAAAAARLEAAAIAMEIDQLSHAAWSGLCSVRDLCVPGNAPETEMRGGSDEPYRVWR